MIFLDTWFLLWCAALALYLAFTEWVAPRCHWS